MSDIVKSVSITNFINQREAVVEKMLAAFQLLAEAEEIALAANIKFPPIAVDYKYPSTERPRLTGEFPDRARAEKKGLMAVDTSAWDQLLNDSGIRTFMDATTRATWKSQIDSGDVPALTIENVASTFGHLYKNRTSMHEQGIIQCFKRLSWDYKTNTPHMFGNKIIVRYLLSASGWPNRDGANELDDLMRAFHLADGLPELDHRLGMYDILKQAYEIGQSQIETAYFKVRRCKNGNGHVSFKRADLVERLNAVIARHFPGALPSPR